MALIPIYNYKYTNPPRNIVQLYDTVEPEPNNVVYYTVCVMLDNDQPIITRLLTDIVKKSTIVGSIEAPIVSTIIRKSYRRDNKWQRDATERINELTTYFEKL
jgi:hypothetical protein